MGKPHCHLKKYGELYKNIFQFPVWISCLFHYIITTCIKIYVIWIFEAETWYKLFSASFFIPIIELYYPPWKRNRTYKEEKCLISWLLQKNLIFDRSPHRFVSTRAIEWPNCLFDAKIQRNRLHYRSPLLSFDIWSILHTSWLSICK